MSLRDYLLTRMALRQDARQRELDIEQARASRQAAEQAAYMQYGNAALQAAVQGTGKIAGAISEADAAQSALEAEAIQARAASRALETTGVPAVGEEVGGVSPKLPMPVGAYKAPQLKFLYDKDTSPSAPPAVIAPDAATPASAEPVIEGKPAPVTPADAKAAETAAMAAADAADLADALKAENQNMGTSTVPGINASNAALGIAQRSTGTSADAALPFVYSAQKTSEEQKPRVESDVFNPTAKAMRDQAKKDAAIEVATTGGTAAKRILSGPISVPEVPAMAAPVVPVAPVSRVDAGGGVPMPFVEPSAVEQGTSDILQRTLQRMQTKDVQDAATPAALQAAIAAPAVVLPADTKMAAAPAEVQRATQGPAGEALAPKVSDVMPIPGMGGGLSIPNPQAILARSTPEEDKVYTKAISDDLDKQIADLKLRTGLDLNKPAVAKSIEQASKVTGYTPPVYTKTARELAKEVTDQVWKTRPPGNPLTALFMRDNSALNKQIAEDKAFLIISGARTKHSAEHLDNFVKLEEIRSKQAMDKRKMDLLEAQAVWNNSRSDKAIRFKTDLPSPERSKLQGLNLAQRSLSNLAETTRAALDEGKGLPLGTDRAMAEAYVKLNASKQGSDSASISAGAGLLGGASLSISQAKSGKPLDDELLQAAFNAVDQSGWTPTQKIMHGEKFKTIQNLGKALEGGKLTDADYVKYVQILINSSDPQTYLMSINRLMKDNYENYNTYKINLSGTYEPSALVGFEPVDPEAFLFNKEEIDSAFAAPIGAAAARVAEIGRNYRGPGTSVNPLVSGAAGTIQALMAKLATLNPNSPDANAIKAEIARLQAEAAGGTGAVEGNPADNPLGE